MEVRFSSIVSSAWKRLPHKWIHLCREEEHREESQTQAAKTVPLAMPADDGLLVRLDPSPLLLNVQQQNSAEASCH